MHATADTVCSNPRKQTQTSSWNTLEKILLIYFSCPSKVTKVFSLEWGFEAVVQWGMPSHWYNVHTCTCNISGIDRQNPWYQSILNVTSCSSLHKICGKGNISCNKGIDVTHACVSCSELCTLLSTLPSTLLCTLLSAVYTTNNENENFQWEREFERQASWRLRLQYKYSSKKSVLIIANIKTTSQGCQAQLCYDFACYSRFFEVKLS